jgi:cytochrome c6
VRASLAFAAAVVLIAGCGGGGGPAGATTGSPRELFVQQCGACHTLADAGTEGVVASNLDKLEPTRQQVLAAIREGPDTMPANLVTGPYARGVAAYVASVAGQ